MNPLTLLAYVAMAGVLITLTLGVINLYRTRDDAQSRSNKLMRLRVLLQFIAVILLMAGLYWKTNH